MLYRLFAPLLLVLISMPGSSRAVDGATEISQACAKDGCFGLDSPGFPINLALRGHYVLTSDLEVDTPAAVSVIEVSANSVTLDLNGFTIRGGTVCTATGAIPNVVTCTPGGAGSSGVAVAPAPTGRFAGITIRNGNIDGMLNTGIGAIAGDDVIIEDVNVRNTSGTGIALPLGATLRRSSVLLTSGSGITAGVASRIESILVQASGGSGIFAAPACTVARALTFGNGLHGILVGRDSIVMDSTARGNGGSGVQAAFGSRLSQINASQNGVSGVFFDTEGVVTDSVFIGNSDDGIHCIGVCLVSGNTIRGNGGDGVEILGGGTVLRNVVNVNTGFGINTVGGTALYDENNLNGNGTGGTQYTDGGGVSGGSNFCGGAAC